MKFKELSNDFEEKRKKRKEEIKQEPQRVSRFGRWAGFGLSFPFEWIGVNIKDIKTAIIFLIVLIVYGASVGVPYLIYFITMNNWGLAAGSAAWLFWLGPGTPFLVLCIGTTIGIKAIINKITRREEK